MDVITRDCPKCAAPLDVETGQRRLNCRYCGSALELVREGSDRDYHLEERPEASEPAIVPCPESLTVEEYGGTLTMSWRWFHPSLFFLLFFCIAWDAFLIVWYTLAFGDVGLQAPGPFRLLMFVFPIAHVAVGVGLTYFVVAGFLNTTKVVTDGNMLRVTHGPIPWKQPTPIPVDDVDQIYVKQAAFKKGNPPGIHEHTPGIGYTLNALNRNGSQTVLLKRLTDSDRALYIANRLREHLGIERQTVSGEYTG